MPRRKPVKISKGAPCPDGVSCKTCLKHTRCRIEKGAMDMGFSPDQTYCDSWQKWTKAGEEELKKKEREEG